MVFDVNKKVLKVAQYGTVRPSFPRFYSYPFESRTFGITYIQYYRFIKSWESVKLNKAYILIFNLKENERISKIKKTNSPGNQG